MKPKLVRDKIPDIIARSGEKPHTHTVQGTDYAKALQAKLQEEVEEYFEDPCIEELADIQEVILALAALHDEDLEKTRIAKRKARGGFAKGIILDSVQK